MGWYAACMQTDMTIHNRLTDIPADSEIQRLKARIVLVWARRESLKQALDSGAVPPNRGLRELESVDRELAELDTRFKRLWDMRDERAENIANPRETP